MEYKFICCYEKDKFLLESEGFEMICTQNIGESIIYVFKNKPFKKEKFSGCDLIKTNKMFF